MAIIAYVIFGFAFFLVTYPLAIFAFLGDWVHFVRWLILSIGVAFFSPVWFIMSGVVVAPSHKKMVMYILAVCIAAIIGSNPFLYIDLLACYFGTVLFGLLAYSQSWYVLHFSLTGLGFMLIMERAVGGNPKPQTRLSIKTRVCLLSPHLYSSLFVSIQSFPEKKRWNGLREYRTGRFCFRQPCLMTHPFLCISMEQKT